MLQGLIGLPPLAAMFNSNGTAYAAQQREIPTRFVLWFNGNGITEKYWIPADTGPDYVPCSHALPRAARSFLQASPARHHRARQSRRPAPRSRQRPSPLHERLLMSGTQFTGRGAGGPSIDQVIAGKVGGDTRFRSLQLGVSQESFGESIQRNMTWAEALTARCLPK